MVQQVEELRAKVAPSRDLRVGISCGPVMVEPGWFGVIKNIVVPGPTVKEAVECEKTAGLYRHRLEALRKGVQPGASPNGGRAEGLGIRESVEGPPSVS